MFLVLVYFVSAHLGPKLMAAFSLQKLAFCIKLLSLIGEQHFAS